MSPDLSRLAWFSNVREVNEILIMILDSLYLQNFTHLLSITYSRFIKQLFYAFKHRYSYLKKKFGSIFHRSIPYWISCSAPSRAHKYQDTDEVCRAYFPAIAANATNGKVCSSILSTSSFIYFHICVDYCMAKWSLSSSLFSRQRAYP